MAVSWQHQYEWKGYKMNATYKTHGMGYLPVIQHSSGHREPLFGAALATANAAKKYAQIEINRRNELARIKAVQS